MPHLNDLAKKYGSKGLVVLATSKEAKSVIDPWIEEKSPEYSIFVDDGGATARSYNVSSIPACALIGPDGKVVYRGHPSSVNAQMLEPVLEKCILHFNYEFPDAFKKVHAYIEKKDFAGVLDALTAAEQIEGADTAFATKVRDDITAYCTDVRKMAESDAAAGDYVSAMESVTELSHQFKGSDLAKPLDDLLDGWKKDPQVKKELKAAQYMGKAQALEREFNFRVALGLYVKVTRSYKGTKAAEKAQARVDTIQRDKLWKIDPKCKKCIAGRKPCEKHAR